ncbi:PorP/SprF family type IX secretion system membrane protein [Fulvivirga sp. 29W222]|uniref:PorP/SprF family type IX secretion system membrane protein n=1 Tax=Fulvivirga marina TaxID=2494733 RepID=A0A937KEA6_9BACT|nr:PorP/SprF family type IX secretion system membrane protein [Fulvivirga marina]MBL6449374.1 PorP/SprF family type IX secretion system membrane protein [Fulvivirga marina]
MISFIARNDNYISMMFFKKFSILFIMILMLFSNVQAQEPNFSMYHYAPFFTNPGQIGAVKDARLMLNYRNQAIESGDNFRTSSLSGYYPVFIGNHKLVIAGNFLNDQASDFVSTNGGLIGVAYSIQISSYSALSLGLQGGYFQRKTDGDFTTDDQFVNGAFDPTIVSGDAVLNQSKSYPTLSGGIYYQLSDESGRDKAFIGASIFNATEPNISFADVEDDNLPLSLKATAGYRVYQGMKFSVMPTLRWVNQADNNFFNLGSRFGYELESTDEGPKGIALGLWYNTNDLGIFSIAYEQPKFTVGVSYDLPVGDELKTGKNGTFELAISFRLKRRTKAYVPQKISPPAKTSTTTQEEPDVVEEETPTEEISESIEEEQVDEEVEQPETEEEQPEEDHNDSPQETETIEESVGDQVNSDNTVTASPELTPEEKKILEETVKFELNSDQLTPESKEFLDKIVSLLKNKEHFNIELTGYTCDLGDEKTNYELSGNRADIVSQYLIKNGVATDRLTVKAGGESNPVANNSTEENRRKNRRVEFKVIY